MLDSINNALVLAPHTDDGELGAGGTIRRLIEQGSKVWYVAFSSAEDSLPEGMPKDTLKIELAKATAELGIPSSNLIVKNFKVRRLNYHRQEILEEMVRLKRELNPELVFMPSPKDIHQDHATVCAEGLRAFKTTSILGYELIWNNMEFQTSTFVKLNSTHLDAKCKALNEYASQRKRDYMKPEFIRSLARVRGVQINAEYAECFEVLRWIM